MEQLTENIAEASGGELPEGVLAAMQAAHDALNPISHFLDMQAVATMSIK